MTTRRKQALETLRARLAGITKAAGYKTDVGLTLLVGQEPVLGPDDPDAAAAMIVQADEKRYEGENVCLVLPVKVAAMARASVIDPHGTVEDIIGDIKTAVEVDHDLGRTLVNRGLERGVTEPMDRQEGSEFVGATVEYRLMYVEQWGQP